MKKKFEEILNEIEPNSKDAIMSYGDVLTLMQKVRKYTLIEATNNAFVNKPKEQTEMMAWNNVSVNDYQFFSIDKNRILDLPTDTIEIDDKF